MRIILFIVLIIFSGKAVALEYVIFKKVHESLHITSLPFKYTVWHIDALNLLKYQIESKGAKVSVDQRVEVMSKLVEEQSHEYIHALMVMGLAGTAKMKAYGLSETPAAVLLDDDGNVVERWNAVVDGHDLFKSEESP